VIYLKSGVGIEIRRDDLLVSCLKRSISGGVFAGFQRITGYAQREPAQVRKELDDFFRKERVNRDNVVLGLPRQDVIMRYLDLPREVEDNLKQVMVYQVQSFEPTEEEKLYYDYVLLPNGKVDKKLQVLTLMVRKSALDAHLQFMSQLGIRPAIVTSGSVAMANMLLGALQVNRDKIFLVADLSPDGIEIGVLRGGTMVYGREAARAKGQSPKQLLLSELEVAVGKVRLDPEEMIESIILAGEDAESLIEEIRTEIQGCELLASRVRFQTTAQNQSIVTQAVTSLGLAYAGMTRRLAMRLNLLPAVLRVRQKRWAYIPTVILGLGIVAVSVGFAFHQRVQQQILIRALEQQSKSLEAPVNRVRAARTEMVNLEKKIAAVEEILTRRDQNLDILRAITEILPMDTFLQIYKNTDCTLMLQGQSPPSSSADVIPKLEKSPLLRDVTNQNATFRNVQTGKDIFTLSAKCEK
jgi:hypothetical protein